MKDLVGERSARAFVTVKVEIPLGAAWGPDCTLGQSERQAAEAAVMQIERVLDAANVRHGKISPHSVVVSFEVKPQ